MATEDAGMEARIARLESDVEHIRSDMADVKTDLRALRDKLDGMNAGLIERIDSVNLSLKDALASAKIWALVLYIAFAGAMFGTMARGFGWL